MTALATKPTSIEGTAQAIPELKGFDQYVLRLMRDWKVPGVAVAIARDGEIVLCQGYGLRNVEQGLPVTPHTLMPIGSTTKTFTTAGIALLADEGRVDWDTPVRTYLPTLALWDRFASERLTPRDMASHRSGLPRHELMWYGSSESRQALFDRLRYLEPSADLRTVWQYQNLMYMTLGYLTAETSGTSWEDFIQQRILDPLGMAGTSMNSSPVKDAPDLSIGYIERKKKLEPMALYEGFEAVAPCGSIVSSVNDMSQWLLVHLRGGKHRETQFLSEPQVRDMHKPHMVIEPGKHPEMPYSSYGLGWFVQPYRGHAMIHHGGNIDGFSAMLGLMPDDGVGVVILTNMNGTPVRDMLMYNVWDRFIGGAAMNWNARMRADRNDLEEAGKRGKVKGKSDRVKGTRPSHPLAAYAGTYTHPGYGSIRFEVDGNAIRALYNDMEFAVKHYHYDVFDVLYERFELTLKASFTADVRGDVHEVSLPFEPTVKPIAFTRAADESMSGLDFLSPFMGAYELMGAVMSVQLKGDVLQISLPGQPNYELVPIKGTEFAFKGLSDVTVEFVRDRSGAVTTAMVNQMGSVFHAQRR